MLKKGKYSIAVILRTDKLRMMPVIVPAAMLQHKKPVRTDQVSFQNKSRQISQVWKIVWRVGDNKIERAFRRLQETEYI